jgi:hypothetical protein
MFSVVVVKQKREHVSEITERDRKYIHRASSSQTLPDQAFWLATRPPL